MKNRFFFMHSKIIGQNFKDDFPKYIQIGNSQSKNKTGKCLQFLISFSFNYLTVKEDIGRVIKMH